MHVHILSSQPVYKHKMSEWPHSPYAAEASAGVHGPTAASTNEQHHSWQHQQQSTVQLVTITCLGVST